MLMERDVELAKSMFTWGKDCKDCFNLLTRSFRSLADMEEWLYQKDQQARKGWNTIHQKKGKVQLYWCKKNQYGKAVANPPWIQSGQKTHRMECWYLDDKEETPCYSFVK